MTRAAIVIIFLLGWTFQSFAQDKSEIIQQRIEFISELYQSENIDLTTFIEQLNYYYEHPINLNYTEGNELE